MCLSKKVDEINASSSSHSSDESTDSFFIGSVQKGKKTTNCQTQEEIKQYKVETCRKQDNQKAWTTSIDTSGLDVEYKLDTGAQANVIPQSLYKRLPRKPRLRQTKEKLPAYDGSEIPVAGKCIIRMKPKGTKDYPVQFFVVPIKSSPILGLETCQRLNLIKQISQIKQPRDNIPEEYSNVFGDIGCLSGEHHINLALEAIPVVQPPRKVPYLLKDKLNAELDRMERNEIIDKADEPTDWVIWSSSRSPTVSYAYASIRTT